MPWVITIDDRTFAAAGKSRSGEYLGFITVLIATQAIGADWAPVWRVVGCSR